MGQVLPALVVEQAAQLDRERPVHLRHPLVGDQLLAGGVEDEHRIRVLDVEGLGLAGHPVDVGRVALRNPLVVDAEEAPQPMDRRLVAGQHREVGAAQPLVGAQPRGVVAPRVDRRLDDRDLMRQPGRTQLRGQLHQRRGRHRADLVAERHRRREDHPLSAPAAEGGGRATLVDQPDGRDAARPLELGPDGERRRHSGGGRLPVVVARRLHD